jgi:hypothetical protein
MGIFLFITMSRTALWPTHQPPIQCVPGAPSLGVKRQGCEADHSPPSSAEVKEWVELYFHSPNTLSWRGAQLKHRDIFNSTLGKYYYFSSFAKFSRGPRWEDQGAVSGLQATSWHSKPSTECILKTRWTHFCSEKRIFMWGILRNVVEFFFTRPHNPTEMQAVCELFCDIVAKSCRRQRPICQRKAFSILL